MNGNTFLTGSSRKFTVTEIEVFEITDEKALPNPACLRGNRDSAKSEKQSQIAFLSSTAVTVTEACGSPRSRGSDGRGVE
jgi:hypothetical protein